MNSITIDPARLAEVAARGLQSGGHRNMTDGMCAMEAASYIAGEPWSDHPQCVSPVIAAFLRSWNDRLSNTDRNRLITPELIAGTIGTRGSAALEKRRSLMAADWLVRVHAPTWLRLAGLAAAADTLAGLPEITSMAQVPSIRGPIEAARSDADAAWDAAWDAAGAAAWAAARAAAWDAAWAAAMAAAWDAAWDAAGAAAMAAARLASGDALTPTMVALQSTIPDLIRRMCALTEADATQEPTHVR